MGPGRTWGPEMGGNHMLKNSDFPVFISKADASRQRLSTDLWFPCFLAETFGRKLVNGVAFMTLQTPLPVGSDLSGPPLPPAPLQPAQGQGPFFPGPQ